MATKKLKVTEVSKLKKLFDICPHYDKTEFEINNFDSSTEASYPRYIINIVNKIRKIDSDLETETRSFEKNCLLEEKNQLTNLLEKEDSLKMENAISAREFVEQDYWVDVLGKTAAIEILTIGKLSTETMTKMVKLPEDAYIEATQICVKLANAIKMATVRAEENIGVFSTEEDTGNQSSQPKRLNLKKIK